MRLSVVVVNWDSREDLEACLDSLRGQTHTDLEVVVVDNGSVDGSAEMVRIRYPEVALIECQENLGFAEGCNRGIAASHGEWVALLNNDAVADAGWAASLVEAARSCPADCGMLQSLMLFTQAPDAVNSMGIELTASGSGRDRGEGSRRPSNGHREEIFCPTAGAAAYRRSMLEAIRLAGAYFDRDHFMYFEDLDLGWRARLAGWSAMYVPSSVAFHRRHGSSNRHGRAWMVVISRTNRIRTLLKNASLPFLLRTSAHTAYEIGELLWHSRGAAGPALARAIVVSIGARRRVAALAKKGRADVETRWVRP